MQPVCVRCGMHPGQLQEYISAAGEYSMTPDAYVMENEGTFNPINGHFLCTPCYVAEGCPSTRDGWKAP